MRVLSFPLVFFSFLDNFLSFLYHEFATFDIVRKIRFEKGKVFKKVVVLEINPPIVSRLEERQGFEHRLKLLHAFVIDVESVFFGEKDYRIFVFINLFRSEDFSVDFEKPGFCGFVAFIFLGDFFYPVEFYSLVVFSYEIDEGFPRKSPRRIRFRFHKVLQDRMLYRKLPYPERRVHGVR